MYCERYHINGKCSSMKKCNKIHSYIHRIAFCELPVEIVRNHVNHMNKTVDENCFLCWLPPTEYKRMSKKFDRCPSLISNRYKCPGTRNKLCVKLHNSTWTPNDVYCITKPIATNIIKFAKVTGNVIPQFKPIYPLDILWNLGIIKNDGVDRFTELPDELILKIFNYVGYGNKMQLLTLRKVCARFRLISNDWTLWKPILVRHNHPMFLKIKVIKQLFNLHDTEDIAHEKDLLQFPRDGRRAYSYLFKLMRRYKKELQQYNQYCKTLLSECPYKKGDAVYEKKQLLEAIFNNRGMRNVPKHVVKEIKVLSDIPTHKMLLAATFVNGNTRALDNIVTAEDGVTFYTQTQKLASSLGWYQKQPNKNISSRD